LLALGIGLVGFFLGLLQVNSFLIPLEEVQLEDIEDRLKTMLENWQFFSITPVLTIWWQNVRAMLLAMLLGTFSLGVLGSLPLILSLGVAGYLMGLLNANGFSIFSYAAFIVPHGIIEIPAAILATAAVLKAGAILATPESEKTVGEVWIEALADWSKVMVGLVIPLLFISACIEAWVTPRVAIRIMY